MWAAIGGVIGLVFLELLKAAVTRGREEAMRKAADERYREQKMADTLEKLEAMTAERDTWKQKYFELLQERKNG